MPKTIERQGLKGVPYVHRYPEIRSGICEFCGVIDSSKPSIEQYKLCPHFKSMGPIRCSYCDENKDPDEINYKAVLNIYDHPVQPDKVVVVCDNFTCVQKHEARFKTAS